MVEIFKRNVEELKALTNYPSGLNNFPSHKVNFDLDEKTLQAGANKTEL